MEIAFFFFGFSAGVIAGVGTLIGVAIKSLGNKKDKGGEAK